MHFDEVLSPELANQTSHVTRTSIIGHSSTTHQHCIRKAFIDSRSKNARLYFAYGIDCFLD